MICTNCQQEKTLATGVGFGLCDPCSELFFKRLNDTIAENKQLKAENERLVEEAHQAFAINQKLKEDNIVLANERVRVEMILTQALMYQLGLLNPPAD